MTTLLEHLTALSDGQLRLLFRHRPDLGIPGVADFSGLATRASTQISVLRALERLNEPQLQVLTAAVVHSAGSASVTDLSALLAPEPAEHQEQVAATVAELLERALLLPATDQAGSEHWAVPGPVRRALGPYPGDLGRPAAALGVNKPVCSREEIDQRITEHPAVEPDDVARLQHALEVLAHSPVARVPDPAGQVLTVLLDTGILVPTETHGTAELPRETGLAARGGTLHRSFSTTPPSTGVTAVLPMLIANAAAASISDLLRAMTALVRVVGAGRGVPTLRTGGIGVREVQNVARRLDTDVEDAAWLLEAAAASDIIALNPDTSHWESRYTTATWSRLPRHRQWQLLVAGWLSSQRAPWSAPVIAPAPQGSSSASASATSTATAATPGRALAPDRTRADAPRLRQGLLEAAGLLDARHPNTAVVDGLEAFRHWQAPRAAARTQAFTAPLATEATRLGLFGAQALTAPGRALALADTASPAVTEDASGLEAAAAAVAELLPAPIRTLRLQADLTAVAPGFLDPELTARLERFADDEGDGTAAVFRFSANTIRRGLDAGLSADAMLELLTDHSGDPVPQTLRYLIDDTARRHLALAVHRGGAVLTVEDPATLTTLLALPELAPAGLRRLSDTVALSRLDDGDLHDLLAETGHRAARPTAAPQTLRPAPSPDPSGPVAAPSFPASSAVTITTQRLTDDDLDAQIRQLRTAPHRPTPSGSGPEELIAGLTEAAHQRRELTVTTADRHGAHLTRRLLPTAVSEGRLRGRDLQHDTDVVVPLHRVVSAEPTAAPTTVSPSVPVEENP